MKKVLVFVVLFIIGVSIFGYCIAPIKENDEEIADNTKNTRIEDEIVTSKVSKEITQWELTLVNYENALPEDFEITLSYIDNIRQFDSRAIEYLNSMLIDMKKDNITNVWVQSAYRSIQHQRDVFDKQVYDYIKTGISKEEAEKMTLKIINRPGTSEHNLGLAVDFNYVDEDFENTKAFSWLKENAEDYGFILRYKKEDEDITKVEYEPWHWRYVGVEHAKEINRLDMCLEEYIEYLTNGNYESNNIGGI